jgi:hypothetical protein
MDVKKLLIGTIVGGVVGMLAGWLVFGMGLAGFMSGNIAATKEPDMLWLVSGHVVFAGLISYIFLQWAGIKTAVSGAKAGGIIALLAGLGTNWIWHGTSDLFPGGCVATLVDAVGGGLVWAIGGAAIGWVIGRD